MTSCCRETASNRVKKTKEAWLILLIYIQNHIINQQNEYIQRIICFTRFLMSLGSFCIQLCTISFNSDYHLRVYFSEGIYNDFIYYFIWIVCKVLSVFVFKQGLPCNKGLLVRSFFFYPFKQTWGELSGKRATPNSPGSKPQSPPPHQQIPCWEP